LFLVAGSTAEMLALERYHEFTGRIATRKRFRNHWHDAAWSRPEVHLDQAFYYLAIWGSEYLDYLDRWRLFIWQRALSDLEKPHIWQRIERVAQRLMAGEVLDQAAVMAAIQ
jgi:hypothetical protein